MDGARQPQVRMVPTNRRYGWCPTHGWCPKIHARTVPVYFPILGFGLFLGVFGFGHNYKV